MKKPAVYAFIDSQNSIFNVLKDVCSNRINTIYVFIDASNIWQAQKAKGKLIDYSKLLFYLKERFKTNNIDFFTIQLIQRMEPEITI